MLTNHPPTEQMQALDAAHHMHPFTKGQELGAKGARVITRADGVFVWDSEGEQILDAMAGLWCVNIGYGRHELASVAERQMRELPYYNTFFQTTHPPVVALAARLAEIAPEGFNQVFFNGSGSDANDTNLRLARHYWATLGKPQKTVVIARKNAYHGSTMAAASLGGMKPMHAQGGLPIADIVHIDQPYWYGEGGESDPEAFGLERARLLEAKILELGADRVAAFIAEPIQGAGGVIIPAESYWPEIQRICKEHNILLIADEVITGYGRTGEWFACESMNIDADIMTTAKGLSSGYIPIGASLYHDRVAEVLATTELAHGYTYSGHPVACAVALENLRIIDEEGMIPRVRDDIAPYLASRWATLGDHALIGETRSRGLLGALELSPNPATRAPFAGERGAAGAIVRDHCLSHGLMMRAVGDTMIVSPPLVISHSEIDLLVERARQGLDDALASLHTAGLL